MLAELLDHDRNAVVVVDPAKVRLKEETGNGAGK